ncbi:MAG: DUF362 domain-containing protein [Draconibacterium sp.]|nr:DUF362 domain-containing protein [Draconibacterium sp.]
MVFWFFLGSGVLFFVNNPGSSFSNTKKTYAFTGQVNTPVGTAIGYYPGRVVWAYNPDATDETCKNVKGDYWYQNTDKAVVQKMMDDAILNLTESETTKEGWDKIFRNFNVRHGKGKTGYKTGEKIVIKINTTNTSETQYEYGARMDATPEVLLAVLTQLINEVGVKHEDIVAGDPYRVFANPLWDLCHIAFPDVHYIDGYGENDREQTRVSDTESLVFSDKENKSRLPEDYMDAAYMINIPCMKSHGSAGISLTAKNHQGSILGSEQDADEQSASHMHYDFPDADHEAMNQYRHLVDYMGHEKLGGNTVLFIVDAIWSGTDWNGAVEKWGMSPFNGDYTSSLFLSQDGVAIESVCYDFLYNEYLTTEHYNAYNSQADYPLWPAAGDFILQAASSDYWPDDIQYDPEDDGSVIGSLGVTEHWNNTTSKQYSVNLSGEIGGIQLVSVPAALVIGEKVNYDPEPLHFGGTSAETINNAKLQVFPNPFTDHLSIKLPDAAGQNALAEIYNSASVCVYSNRTNAGGVLRIDGLASLKNGLYILKVQAGKEIYTTKINK